MADLLVEDLIFRSYFWLRDRAWIYLLDRYFWLVEDFKEESIMMGATTGLFLGLVDFLILFFCLKKFEFFDFNSDSSSTSIYYKLMLSSPIFCSMVVLNILYSFESKFLKVSDSNSSILIFFI